MRGNYVYKLRYKLLGLGSGSLALRDAALLRLARAALLVANVSAHEVVPPAEASRVAAEERHVVVVVVVSTRPERQDVAQAEGEVVARVRINRLEQTQNDPDVHRDDMQVLGDGAQQERSTNRAETEDQHLERVRVLGSKAEWRAELVVDLVDVLVENAVVQTAVGPVVERVLKDEEESDLPCHLEVARKWHLVGRETEVFANRVEAPDLGELDGEVTEKDETSAAPLLRSARDLGGLELVLAHRGHRVNNDPRDRTAKVDNLVEQKAHDTCGNHGVAPVQVPVDPELLHPPQVGRLETLVQDRGGDWVPGERVCKLGKGLVEHG